jgi:DNA-binding transcriptional LysR family regulator
MCKLRRYFRHGTLIQLRVFEAVVRLGSFTRAGEELHMAQPTVSVHMKKLAETMGTPLVEYTGKRVRLTPAGETVHGVCRRMFGLIEELDAALNPPPAVELAKAPAGAAEILPARRAACFKSVCRKG